METLETLYHITLEEYESGMISVPALVKEPEDIDDSINVIKAKLNGVLNLIRRKKIHGGIGCLISTTPEIISFHVSPIRGVRKASNFVEIGVSEALTPEEKEAVKKKFDTKMKAILKGCGTDKDKITIFHFLNRSANNAVFNEESRRYTYTREQVDLYLTDFIGEHYVSLGEHKKLTAIFLKEESLAPKKRRI